MQDDQTSSPMKAAYPAPVAGGGQGDFYGPNMPGHVAQHQPTPPDKISSFVQFAPGGFMPGPIDSPMTTAIPIGSTPAGSNDQHAASQMDSPFTATRSQQR